jgi:DNA repair protein RadB
MERLQTNTPLDKLLNGGIEKDVITNIYGPAGSGKTNIALCSVIQHIGGKKVVYVDTEGSFSPERFEQLGGTKDVLKNIIFIEPTSWDEQIKNIQNLEKVITKDVALIVIDSLVTLYRLELDQENFKTINKQLATQYSILSRIARKHKISVLVTNQVYSTKDDEIELTSRAIAKYWSKTLIELRRTGTTGHRVAIVRKHRSIPENKSIEFEIKEKELKEIGKLSIF